MAGRKKKPEVNRREHHAKNVAKAETPKQKLWAYCHWLVAEAFHAGPTHLDEATTVVQDQIDKLTTARKEGNR